MTAIDRSLKMPGVRFEPQRAIHGWLVVDRDGRPVTDLTTESLAITIADDLNLAAFGGREALSRALGAIT